MPINQEGQAPTDLGDEIVGWQIPEYEKYGRTKTWYIIASIIAVILLIYSVYTKNFLFTVIVFIASLTIIIRDGREPDLVYFSLTDEGVLIGKKFIDYDEFKNFSIVYKPRQGVRNLYFEYKNQMKPRVSIPLNDMNPLLIRENLLKYLTEDLERTDRPVSEELARMLKL